MADDVKKKVLSLVREIGRTGCCSIDDCQSCADMENMYAKKIVALMKPRKLSVDAIVTDGALDGWEIDDCDKERIAKDLIESYDAGALFEDEEKEASDGA